VRNITFAGPEDFFQDRMLAYVEKTWDQWLGPLLWGPKPTGGSSWDLSAANPPCKSKKRDLAE